MEGANLNRIAQRLHAGEAVVAGILSGTSGDGVDVALVRLQAPSEGGPPQVLDFQTLPFEADLGGRVRRVLDGEPLDLRGVALLDRDLGRAFGRAARVRAEAVGLTLDLAGSHGQTVWHHDDREPSGPATLQLGDGAEVAATCGATCVSDFRSADVAAGGGGAPLTALVEAELFPDEPRPLLVLNLGGIANLTVLDSDGTLTALDVGPANSLLDGLARRHLGQPLDPGGRAAEGGRPDEAWIAAVLEHPFYAAAAPKSTGRDTFGESWIESLVVHGARLDPADQLRSAAEAIAISVARALEPLPRGARLLVAGGGVHHEPLMGALGAHTGLEVVPSSAAGIDPDAREAVGFAVLAGRALRGVASSHPGATGARPGAVLGKISPLVVAGTGSRAPAQG